MQRYLVTGCAGFIGSRVAAQLLECGHAVTGVDDLSASYPVAIKRWRLAGLLSRPGFRFEAVDVADPVAMEECFAQDVADDAEPPYPAVIHLAGRAGVRQSAEDPLGYFRANVDGTVNVLDLCRRHGVRKLVFASSSSVYGSRNEPPYREDADTDHPLSAYAASKKAAEVAAYAFHHLYGLDVSVLRYFTVYGPAGRPDMCVFSFIHRLASRRPIVVFGDGQQCRDFTYVDDIVRGTIDALRPVGFDVINLGASHPAPLGRLIEKLGRLLGCEPQIEREPAQAEEVRTTWADIAKAKRLLDWTPAVSLDEGLERTVEWYVKNREQIARWLD